MEVSLDLDQLTAVAKWEPFRSEVEIAEMESVAGRNLRARQEQQIAELECAALYARAWAGLPSGEPVHPWDLGLHKSRNKLRERKRAVADAMASLKAELNTHGSETAEVLQQLKIAIDRAPFWNEGDLRGNKTRLIYNDDPQRLDSGFVQKVAHVWWERTKHNWKPPAAGRPPRPELGIYYSNDRHTHDGQTSETGKWEGTLLLVFQELFRQASIKVPDQPDPHTLQRWTKRERSRVYPKSKKA